MNGIILIGMGRLPKAKIDKIRKLRQEGYIQKEVAQELDLDIKTVRKYDPLRQEKPGGVLPEPPKAVPEEISKEVLDKMNRGWGEPAHIGPSSPIEDQLAALSEWVNTLIFKVGEPLLCPNCLKHSIRYAEWETPDGWDGAYVCQECGYPMPPIEPMED